MHSFAQEILEKIKNNTPLVQVTIIEQDGSTPRTAGTKMLVFEDASISGTVGGGLYEAKAIEFAVNLLKNKQNIPENQAHFLSFDMKVKDKPTDMDMICGGALRLLLEYIAPSSENLNFYQSLAQSDANNIACVVVTKLSYENKIERAKARIEKALVGKAIEQEINISLLPKEVLEIIKEDKDIPNYFRENEEYCFDTIKKPYTLYIFGAGHVSCELAKIAEYLDFKTVVLDDREEFCNKTRFSKSKTIVLPSLDKEHIASFLTSEAPSKQEGIIIVTRGHARDKEVLECALKTSANYIGMIGSKSKKQATYNRLLNSGYTEEDLQRIYSPIGLSIGAQSPEEIAISICAQLIQWRANKLNS